MKKITYSAPSVKKAFKILYEISDASNGLGISDLSKKLKIGKSTVHGITAALEEMGILVRDPVHKQYNWALASWSSVGPPMRRLS